VKYTTIGKDDPGTWPPGEGLLVVQYAARVLLRRWNGEWVDTHDAAEVSRQCESGFAGDWHGDRWALLPEPEDK
jgi:hypothetical protein